MYSSVWSEPSARLQLRKFVKEHLADAVVSDLVQEPDLSPDDILRLLDERGAVADLFAAVKQSLGEPTHSGVDWASQRPSPPPVHPPVVIPSVDHRHLELRLMKGMAFVDFVSIEEFRGSVLVIDVIFAGSRVRSRPVQVCTDPAFDQTFLLPLPALTGSSLLNLLEKPVGPAKMVVTRLDPTSNVAPALRLGEYTSEVMASHNLDWRQALSVEKVRHNVELRGIGKKSQLTVGVLQVELGILPEVPSGLIPSQGVERQVEQEARQRSESTRLAFSAVDRWWEYYRQVHRRFEKRVVKLLAQTENRVFLPVTSFLAPIRGGRHLRTPFHAARFVSLIAVEKVSYMRAKQEDAELSLWHSFPVIFAKRTASVEEHALLLCSFLLGFCLDAYVCLGVSADGFSHAWVITRDALPHGGHQVTFWESLTGEHYPMESEQVSKRYKIVHCAFNHNCFHALACIDERLDRIHFDFEDQTVWHPLSPEVSRLPFLKLYESSTTGHPGAHVLSDGGADLPLRMLPAHEHRVEVHEVETSIESNMIQAVAAHRQAVLGADTVWDTSMGYVLGTALASFEFERTVGRGYGEDVFAQMLRSLCGNSETVQILPVQFNHLRCSAYLPHILQSPMGRSIVEAGQTGHRVALALRCQVVFYPEAVCGVWLVVAVRQMLPRVDSSVIR
mmetsp:Transcript_42594/g.95844  ORF Transcript_42594/g.95844 Transcript_42594/m.95844 type:complete len:673 (-) Transcript_42594:1-2019(-)